MPLQLTVDGERWRAHLRQVADAQPGLVPVAKGNGYGFGLGRLARKADWLGVEALAVGTYEELPEVADRYAGDLLVLTPWRPFADPGTLAAKHRHRVVHTVGRTGDVEALLDAQPAARHRPGTAEQHEAPRPVRRPACRGRPARSARIRRPGSRASPCTCPLAEGAHLAEVESVLVEAGEGIGQVWVSHLTTEELDRLRMAYPALRVRPRIGTDLWLGDRAALQRHLDGAGRAPGREGRGVRLPRPVRAARTATCSW